MSKKLHPLAVAFRAADALSDDEKTALRDYLRPAPKSRSKPKPERKPSQKRKAGKEATSEGYKPGCTRCGFTFDDNIHHKLTTDGYHEFKEYPNVEPAGEASEGVGA